MPELDAEHRDQIADGVESVLDAHELVAPDRCDCGYYVAVPSDHKWHVACEAAPLIAGWLAEAEAAALREAADEAEALRSFAHGKNPISEAHLIGYGTARRVIVRQLRDRADRIGSGDE